MEDQLSLKTTVSFANAKAIYKNGGHSKSIATITLLNKLLIGVSKGAPVMGQNASGAPVTGKLYSNILEGLQEAKVLYSTSDDQDNHVGCQVGSLVDTKMFQCFKTYGNIEFEGGCEVGSLVDTTMNWRFKGTGPIEFEGVIHTYSYTPVTGNTNVRTM